MLALLLAVYTSNQVDRSVLTYVKSDLIKDLNITTGQYGLLTGYGFSLIFVFSGIMMGRIADVWSRKWLLFCGLMLWSGVTAAAGLSQNFGEFFATRLGLGIGQAACNPAAFALITDYFPASARPVASSIYNGGIYLGSGLSAALGASALEKDVGWRWIYFMFGFFGLGMGVLLAVFVKEPERGRYTKAATTIPDEETLEDFAGTSDERKRIVPEESSERKKYTIKETVLYLMHLNTAGVLGLAGGVRSLGGYAFGGFVPNYLQKTFNPLDADVSAPLLLFSSRVHSMPMLCMCCSSPDLPCPSISLCTFVSLTFL